jgi:eukaryotic-like serine/threonine-protein kinase
MQVVSLKALKKVWRMDETNNGGPSDDPAVLALSQSLPARYKVRKVMGRGGMGTVFQAYDRTLGRNVAIKVLTFEGSQQKNIQERFLREARTMAPLDHANIVKVFASGLTGAGNPFYVMEYLEGCTLKDELARCLRLSPARFHEIFSQVLAGLACAHQHQIVHRDLKPANIILCASDAGQKAVKLVDFGIARNLDSEGQDANLTGTNVVLGSPAYMSPEQCRSGRGDRQSDIYSLGCVMYECLSGCPPFEGETPLEIMYKHTSSPAPSLPPTCGTKPLKKLAELVKQCLEKDPPARPQSAELIKASLDAIFEQYPPELTALTERKKTAPPSKFLLILAAFVAAGSAICLFQALHRCPAGNETGPGSTEPARKKDRPLNEMRRLKEQVNRTKGCFDELTPQARAKSEVTMTLLKALQRLANAQMESKLPQDHSDALKTCTTQLSISKSIGNPEHTAAGYILKSQAESLLDQHKPAYQDAAACEKIILKQYGPKSGAWQDFLLHRSMIAMRHHDLKAAESDLFNLFERWHNADEYSPLKVVNQDQYLDSEGPDRKKLVAICLETLKKIHRNHPADIEEALSIANLLTIELFRLKEFKAARQGRQFCQSLLSDIPAGQSELRQKTESLLSEFAGK